MTEKRGRFAGGAPDLGDGDYAALASFRRSLRIFLAFSSDAARDAGLTPQQHQAILAIRGLAPTSEVTVNDLAEHLLLKPQTAVELVDRLEEAGLVQRKRAAEDRRRVLLSLTARAEILLAPLSKAHLAQIGRDAGQLIELLERMSEYAHGRPPPT
jgi:DNA-binding MarR family transcriptional regulator